MGHFRRSDSDSYLRIIERSLLSERCLINLRFSILCLLSAEAVLPGSSRPVLFSGYFPDALGCGRSRSCRREGSRETVRIDLPDDRRVCHDHRRGRNKYSEHLVFEQAIQLQAKNRRYPLGYRKTHRSFQQS